MKKIALCSLMVCLGMVNAYGATQCKTSITFTPDHNNWNAGSNEYLFETKRDYLSAVNSGYVYECDSSWCPDGSYVEVESGHVFQDRTIREKAFYKCSTSWNNDKWERVSSVAGLTKCTKPWYWASDVGIDKWLQDKIADEYLYPTVTDWDAINSRVYSQVYECDNTVCADGTIITLPAGHVFERNEVNKQRKYKCVLGTPGDDKWVDITDDCEDCNKDKPVAEQCTYNGKKYNIGERMDTKPCSETPARSVKAKTGKTCDLYCMKRQVDAKKPVGSYSLDQVWMVKECPTNYTKVPFETEYGENKSDAEYNKWTTKVQGYKMCEKGGSVVPPGDKSCKDSRSTAEGKACCDLAANEAKWENNQCKCLNGKKFKIVDGRGKCVAEQGGEEETECEYSFNATIECANGSNYSGYHTVKLTKEDLRGETCTTFQQRFENDIAVIQKYKDMLCGKYIGFRLPDQNGPSAGELQKAQETMALFVNDAKGEASVWKDSEGKFNTARLASDLTAGVVLGTVGGVVSGVVIKKKQVEKGFDALHCTVGGQKIADWGDEFSVGLQR